LQNPLPFDRPSVRFIIKSGEILVGTQARVAQSTSALSNSPDPDYDWAKIAYHLNVSRTLDDLEERTLMPAKKSPASHHSRRWAGMAAAWIVPVPTRARPPVTRHSDRGACTGLRAVSR